MRFSLSFCCALSLIVPILAQLTFETSSKRGLAFVPSATHPSDDQIWVQSRSDLTWYYNYAASPSSSFANLSQSDFEFVPMLWGAPATTNDTSFQESVQSMINLGRNITHILTFNGADEPFSQGGSQMDPTVAAETWTREIIPLQNMGIKAGAPVTTQNGLSWLTTFLADCPGCEPDFFCVHYYGNFQGLTKQIAEMRTMFPNKNLWITEYGYNDQPLSTTQSFFNSSAAFFDQTPYIERYSYYGAFRSTVSNVGPNAAMLDASGQLTDIGSWYLGRAATNNIPSVASKPIIFGAFLLVVIAAATAAMVFLWR